MNTRAIELSRASVIVRSRSTRWALAHVEGRRLVTHPIFLLGLVVGTAQGLMMAQPPRSPGILFAFNDGICTFLVTFLAASRAQRDHAHDIYGAQPTSSPLRTQAALLSLGYAAAAGVVVVLALALVGSGPAVLGSGGEAEMLRPLGLLDGALHVASAGALGVLVGTWTRHIQVAAPVVLVLFVSPMTLSSTLSLNPLMGEGVQLLSGGTVIDVVLSLSGPGATYADVAGLTALAAAGALARHDRRPRIVILALLGLGAIAGLLALAIATGLALVLLLWPHPPGPARAPAG